MAATCSDRSAATRPTAAVSPATRSTAASSPAPAWRPAPARTAPPPSLRSPGDLPRSGPNRVDQRPLTFVPSHNSLTGRSDEPEHAVDRLPDPTPSSTRTPTGVRYGVGHCGQLFAD